MHTGVRLFNLSEDLVLLERYLVLCGAKCQNGISQTPSSVTYILSSLQIHRP